MHLFKSRTEVVISMIINNNRRFLFRISLYWLADYSRIVVQSMNDLIDMILTISVQSSLYLNVMGFHDFQIIKHSLNYWILFIFKN